MKKPEATTTETILLVEDEPAVRQLVSVALQRAGYHVLEAQDGEDALARFDAHEGSIDLLVTDLRMPQMDGIELVRLLRERVPHLKVICVSGYPSTGMNRAVTEHYLNKPFSRAELLDKVRQVLDSH
jgi:two-component system cell cycle sensor histidine kinase/response regulator CckA